MKSREEDDIVEFLQEAAFELGLLDNKELWFMHSDRAPELKGKKVRRFLVRNDAVPLRGASNRSTTHSREEAFVKRALRGTRVMLRGPGLSIKYWPHAARTFTVSTNWRSCGHGLEAL